MNDKKSNIRANKSRIEEIDEIIEQLSGEVSHLHGFVSKSEFEFYLITAKVKRQKVNALAAAAKSQVLLANMDILIAESDLRSDLERLRNYQKKLKLESLEAKTLERKRDTPVSTKRKSKSKSSPIKTSNPKRRKKSSDARKPSPADISSDDTVIIDSLPENKIDLVDDLQDCLTQLTKPHSPAEIEVSLPSFLKAEFNKPYEESDNQTHKKTDSKGKSSVTKHPSPIIKTKTVSDINKTVLGSKLDNSKDLSSLQTPKSSRPKSDDRRATPSTSTYVPIRHNMPMIVTQAKNYYRSVPTTVMSPCQNIGTSSSVNMFQPSGTVPNLNFFGSKQ